MNKDIALTLIGAELRRLRQLAYSELIKLLRKPETKQVVGGDGKSYQLEIEVIWDSANGKDVKVIVAADDGGWRAFKPLTGDLIIRPDGSFVRESLRGY
jgi:hypothetical protein